MKGGLYTQMNIAYHVGSRIGGVSIRTYFMSRFYEHLNRVFTAIMIPALLSLIYEIIS